jgi:hypothetical protein
MDPDNCVAKERRRTSACSSTHASVARTQRCARNHDRRHDPAPFVAMIVRGGMVTLRDRRETASTR